MARPEKRALKNPFSSFWQINSSQNSDESVLLPMIIRKRSEESREGMSFPIAQAAASTPAESLSTPALCPVGGWAGDWQSIMRVEKD
jgi:hypothetical protein